MQPQNSGISPISRIKVSILPFYIKFLLVEVQCSFDPEYGIIFTRQKMAFKSFWDFSILLMIVVVGREKVLLS
ncbi:hypothetical protein CLW00_1051 [Mongoliibacter ruber]|uniref:Uncharacterized protein n=1 Tax=Mongoliibacter ruber TaxID=1750599 RepID=A0A2T0WMF4_9BACT|nr:hypothetical protein CLW00_1051 [Mongoliibacter ruber]